jgi:hypothetical protein
VSGAIVAHLDKGVLHVTVKTSTEVVNSAKAIEIKSGAPPQASSTNESARGGDLLRARGNSYGDTQANSRMASSSPQYHMDWMGYRVGDCACHPVLASANWGIKLLARYDSGALRGFVTAAPISICAAYISSKSREHDDERT